MKSIYMEHLTKPVTQLVLGTALYEVDQYSHATQLLDSYSSLGGTVLDTAENYAGGQSERVIGRWMSERDNRESMVVMTKGGHPYNNKNRVNPEEITTDLMGSLERLQTNYIDIYMLHRDDPSYPVAPIINMLNKHIMAGRILTIGASNWTVDRISEANEYAKAEGLFGFTCNSQNLSLAKAKEPMWPGCVSADSSMLEWHTKTQMPLLSWASQAGGFFTGRFVPELRHNSDIVRVYYDDNNWEMYARAQKLAVKKACEPVHIALAYVLGQPFPSCGIIGARTVGEIVSNAHALQIELTEQEVRWLDLIE